MNSVLNRISFAFSILAFAFILSCNRSAPIKTVQWSSSEGTPAPFAAITNNFDPNPLMKSVGNESVDDYRQVIDGVEIYGSYARSIRQTKTQKPVFMRAQYLEQWDSSYSSSAQKMKQQLPGLLEKLKNEYPVLKKAFSISPPKLIFMPNQGSPQLLFVINWLEASGEEGHRWFLNRRLKIVRQEKRKSEFTTGRALVYPRGPRLSPLDRVELPDLKGTGYLVTDKLKLTTRASTLAQSTDSIFEYQEDDVRFDQVQVFHFAQSAVDGFRSKYSYDLASPLEIITHIGFPDKKSVMFYFDHKINLGQGDNITYKNIMWDPTIVLHEMMHAFIDELGHLKQGSVNEAFADYFSCALTGNAKLGEASYLEKSYTRALDAEKVWSDLNGGTYNDSLVLSSLLWEMRKTLGAVTTDDFAIKLLVRLDPKIKITDMPPILSSVAAEILKPEDQERLTALLEKKGWTK